MNRVTRDEHHADTSDHNLQRAYKPAAHAGSVAHREHDSHADRDKHAGHSVAMFRDKFWLSFALTIPTLIWGHMLPSTFGYRPPAFAGSQWIAPVLGTAVFLYGGWPFVQGDARAPPRHDDADCARDRRCICF